MSSKDTKIVKTIVGILMAIGLFYASFAISNYFYFDEQQTDINTKNKLLEFLIAQNNQNEKLKANMEQLEQALLKAEDEAKSLKKLLPSEAEVPAVLNWVANRAYERGLKLEHFNQLDKKASNNLTEVSLNVEVSGNYDSAGRFLEDFARYERVLNVKTILMTQKLDQSQPTTLASINFVAFVSNQKPPDKNLNMATNLQHQ